MSTVAIMDPDQIYRRYQELQAYVGWDARDTGRVQAVAGMLDPYLPALIEDFYAEIERHPAAHRVITGGQEQIGRLKRSLLGWIRELLAGPYDRDYVLRRRRVGRRHVEIGLDQLYTNVALSRLRTGLVGALGECWPGEKDGLVATIQSLNKLLDLDLAKIEDAYQAEYIARQQRSERLAAIGQVAGGVAHELRNPLNVVKTSAYYLLNARNPTPEKKADHLQRIGQGVGRADAIITALSNFARMPVPSLSPFPVPDCVREALEQNPLPAGVRLDLDLPPSLPPALGDAGQVGIVFANLIRNARDAMPGGGQLTVRARAADGGVEVSFTDTGMGIDPANLSRVLEPLYSTKAHGLGLGLALAKAILDKHRGTLRVESEPGQGSRFTVRLTAEEAGEGRPT